MFRVHKQVHGEVPALLVVRGLWMPSEGAAATCRSQKPAKSARACLRPRTVGLAHAAVWVEAERRVAGLHRRVGVVERCAELRAKQQQQKAVSRTPPAVALTRTHSVGAAPFYLRSTCTGLPCVGWLLGGR